MRLAHQSGLPLFQRYANWLGGLVRGDLGTSRTGTSKAMVPVWEELLNRVPISLRLVLLGTIIGTVLGVALGMVSAVPAAARSTTGPSPSVRFLILALPTPVIILIVQQDQPRCPRPHRLGSAGYQPHQSSPRARVMGRDLLSDQGSGECRRSFSPQLPQLRIPGI